MNSSDTKPDLLSILSGSSYTNAPLDYKGTNQGDNDLSREAMRQQNRESALDRFYPPPQPQNLAAVLPLLQLLTQGAIAAPPLGTPPPQQPMMPQPQMGMPPQGLPQPPPPSPPMQAPPQPSFGG